MILFDSNSIKLLIFKSGKYKRELYPNSASITLNGTHKGEYFQRSRQEKKETYLKHK